MSHPCQICRAPAVSVLIAAGAHPVSNRFLKMQNEAEERFSLALGQCQVCGLVQLTERMAVDELVSRFDWLTYNEPESHLDSMTESILNLPGLGPDPIIGAITYKDESTLARFRQRGVERTWRLEMADLGGSGCAGVETLQERLTPHHTRQLTGKYAPADVLVVRQILEHAYDTHQFAEALRTWVRPGGYLVFEVPDSAQAVATCDYSRIWEEHVLYFTPTTLLSSLHHLGFDVRRYDCYEYPHENSLVAIVQDSGSPAAPARTDGDAVARECELGARFAMEFEPRRSAVQAFLRQHRALGGRTAVFGAGHLAAMFINLMDVGDEIEFVAEDHPKKQGLFMPGSRLPIKGSSHLLADRIDLCLSSLSPESELRVIARQGELLAGGSVVASIFPASPRALKAITGER